MSGEHFTEVYAEELGELATNETLKQTPDIPTLAKRLVDAQNIVGRSVRVPTDAASDEQLQEFYTDLEKVDGVVRLPGDDASEEAIQAFNKKLGTPETPDDYKPEVPEGQELDQARFDAIKKTAHGLGLSNKKLNTLLGADAKYQEAVREQISANIKQHDDALRAEWGEAYDEKRQLTERLAEHFGGDDWKAFAKENPEAATDPRLIKMLSGVSDEFKEGKITDVIGGERPKDGALTPSEAAQKLHDIRMNKEHAYNTTKASPDARNAAAAEVYRLTCWSKGQTPDPQMVKWHLGQVKLSGMR